MFVLKLLYINCVCTQCCAGPLDGKWLMYNTAASGSLLSAQQETIADALTGTKFTSMKRRGLLKRRGPSPALTPVSSSLTTSLCSLAPYSIFFSTLLVWFHVSTLWLNLLWLPLWVTLSPVSTLWYPALTSISCRDDWSSGGRTLASETDLDISGSGLIWGGEMGREDNESAVIPCWLSEGGLGVGYQSESNEQGNINKSQAGKNKARWGGRGRKWMEEKGLQEGGTRMITLFYLFHVPAWHPFSPGTRQFSESFSLYQGRLLPSVESKRNLHTY